MENTVCDVSLVEILLTQLSNKKFIIKTKISSENLQILNLVLNKCPSIINSMGTHIQKIMSDQEITLTDIPEIILLIQEVLNVNFSQINKLQITRNQIIMLVKDIFIILIESNIIKTNPELKQNCLLLLDLSVKLLESTVQVQKVIKCKCLNFFTK